MSFEKSIINNLNKKQLTTEKTKSVNKHTPKSSNTPIIIIFGYNSQVSSANKKMYQPTISNKGKGRGRESDKKLKKRKS